MTGRAVGSEPLMDWLDPFHGSKGGEGEEAQGNEGEGEGEGGEDAEERKTIPLLPFSFFGLFLC